MTIDMDSAAIGKHFASMFAGEVAQAAHAATGFEFVVVPNTDGGVEVVTSSPDAVQAEYGNVDTPGGSWSVKAIFEAERTYGQP